nr:unnamed protein product [Callosobruchus analis]
MCSDVNFGVSTKEARRLAYKLAAAYNKKCPSSWQPTDLDGCKRTIFIHFWSISKIMLGLPKKIWCCYYLTTMPHILQSKISTFATKIELYC